MHPSTSPLSGIRFATFLSPVLYPTYEYIANYINTHSDSPTDLHIGQSLAEFATGVTDIGFLCGLQYVRMKEQPVCPVELLVAPVLEGCRYQRRPLYYSDVIVHHKSLYHNFDDLSGCTWAYNECASHSGYNLVCYSLLERGKNLHYFDKWIATGSHLQSLQAVLDGRADSTALDSHLLDVLQQERPDIAANIRVIDSFGPSGIPPLVVAKQLDEDLKQQIRLLLTSMHDDPCARRELHKGCIERFVPVDDKNYDDIRFMLNSVQMKHVSCFFPMENVFIKCGFHTTYRD